MILEYFPGQWGLLAEHEQGQHNNKENKVPFVMADKLLSAEIGTVAAIEFAGTVWEENSFACSKKALDVLFGTSRAFEVG